MRKFTQQTGVILGLALIANTDKVFAENKKNVLLIIADDVGRDALSMYGGFGARTVAKTPNLDKLSQQGLTFDNFWATPLSSPTRASIITGRHGFRTGVLTAMPEMNPQEMTLFRYLKDENICSSTSLFGKWHLSRNDNLPSSFGVEEYAGYIRGGVESYYNWSSYVNQTPQRQDEYAPTVITRWAKDWIEKQDDGWFAWVAYPSAHTPFHRPPTYTTLPEYSDGDDELPYFIAMVEALDFEIGKLLEAVDLSNTLVMFVGDNGTANQVVQGGITARKGKGTLYQGGINTPLIIAGAGVERQNERDVNLVAAVDLFPTIVESLGGELDSYQDGFNFDALFAQEQDGAREYLFSDCMSNRLGYVNAVSDGRYKLISVKGEAKEFYDLKSDPFENNNLLDGNISGEAKAALDKLKSKLESFEIPTSVLHQTSTMSNSRGGARGGKGKNTENLGGRRPQRQFNR